jgi:hypothetical protein
MNGFDHFPISSQIGIWTHANSVAVSLMFQNDVLVPLPLNTIHIAYAELCRHVDVTLQVQIGDAARLGETSPHSMSHSMYNFEAHGHSDKFISPHRGRTHTLNSQSAAL